MVDLHGKDKGNISLPAHLQSPDLEDDKNEDNQSMILNMQIAMYETIIDELRLKVERLQTRNEQLEEFCESVNNNSYIKNIEAEREIVELNTAVALETKKVDDLKNQFLELEKIREEQKKNHLDKVNNMEEKFERSRIKFFSEIKLINSKLNTIENFKSVEKKMHEKFKNQQDLISQKEEEMQQTLNEIEQKSKIHKQNLKKEAYKKVMDASENFQIELKHTVPITAQRLMRENIVLENELVQMWNDQANINDQNFDYSYRIQEFKKRIKEAKTNLRRRIITFKTQKLLLQKLKHAYLTVKDKLSKSFEPSENFEQEYLKLIEEIQNSESRHYDFQRRKLEVMLHQENLKLNLANGFKRTTILNLNRCYDVLNNLKNFVNSAITASKLQNADDNFRNMDLNSLASYIFEQIEDYESKKWISDTESTKTMEDVSNIYEVGDLGFEPKHIEFKSFEKIANIRSISIENTFEILKELEELQYAITDAEKDGSKEKSDSSTDLSIDNKSVQKSEASSRVSKGDSYKKAFTDIDHFYSGESEYEYEMKYEYQDFLNYDEE